VRRLVDALGLQEFSSASTIGLQGATPQDTAGVAVPTGAPRDGPAPLSGFGGGFLVSWGAEREDRGRGDGGEGPGAEAKKLLFVRHRFSTVRLFSTVRSVGALHSSYTRALTFSEFWAGAVLQSVLLSFCGEGLRCPQGILLRLQM
jgi:hypothetical protein